MTKAELEKDRDEWKEQAESLQDELDELDEAYTELENENFKLSNNIKTFGIKDINNFIFRLKIEGLYTKQMEKFIECYMRWNNEEGV